jgi:fructose-bisphosphate aldolase class II
MLTPTVELLQAARAGNYALIGFSVCNMEMVQAVIQAAEESSSPVVLSLSEGFYEGLPSGYLEALMRHAGENASVPVAINLDHGTSLMNCAACIRKGYSSVMIDGSHLPFEENIALTSKVVEFAHAAGVAVEGAVGLIEREVSYTDPAQAEEFARVTGVDALAVSIGEYSGFYAEEPNLDYPLLEEIRGRVDAHLVLHGASGLSEGQLRKAIGGGISYAKFGTDLRNAFFETIDEMRRRYPDNPIADPRVYLWPATLAVKEQVQVKLAMMGSIGKAMHSS